MKGAMQESKELIPGSSLFLTQPETTSLDVLFPDSLPGDECREMLEHGSRVMGKIENAAIVARMALGRVMELAANNPDAWAGRKSFNQYEKEVLEPLEKEGAICSRPTRWRARDFYNQWRHESIATLQKCSLSNLGKVAQVINHGGVTTEKKDQLLELAQKPSKEFDQGLVDMHIIEHVEQVQTGRILLEGPAVDVRELNDHLRDGAPLFTWAETQNKVLAVNRAIVNASHDPDWPRGEVVDVSDFKEEA